MTLVKNKFRHNAFPVLFDDAFFKDFFDVAPKVSKNVPAVNVKESDKEFQVEIAAPGLRKEDFKVTVEDNILTISSEAKKEEETSDEQGKYTRKEFHYTSFSRSFTLDEQHIDVDNIQANYDAGVLQLLIPKKTAPEKIKKSIDIQ